ncbi:MAG: type III-A CRISPR-associated RAMP protein Csm3 [Clostridia bacterium]|nr:type III-A CRISPR-associated RAMP protein Csm3 [Clostridia bacterium]
MKKIIIRGIIEVKTGMHIGGNSAYSAIGMVDSPVIKDKCTKLPIIPGSSLKGKLRSLLSFSKHGCKVEVKDDGAEINRLFGSSDKNNIMASRLQFSDCFYIQDASSIEMLPYEIKYENAIDRKKVKANPRQIERVVKGSRFNLMITYNVEQKNEVEMDMENLLQSLKMLQLDYLGGGGSRGNGRIVFKDLKVSKLDENCELVEDEDLTSKFAGVVEYGELCYKV